MSRKGLKVYEKAPAKPEKEETIKPSQNRLATPIKEEYRGALNQGGLIGILDSEFIDKIDFSTGRARLKDDKTQLFDINTLKKNEVKAKNFDFALLKALYSIIFQAKEGIKGSRVYINRNDLNHFTGQQLRGNNINEFIKKVSSFNNAYGFLPNGGHYKMLTYVGYDLELDTFIFDIEFILKLIEIQQTEKIISTKEGRRITQPNHSYLIHSDITKEKDKIAILIVERIEQLLISAGKTKNPSIGIKKLIDDIPQLKEKLENTEQTKHPAVNKNNILKRHFSKAYELMKTKTDFYSFFKDLEIPKMKPTSKTYETDVLRISHKGKKNDNR